MNLYRRDDDNKWMQINTIESGVSGGRCSISGDTIAVIILNGSYSIQLYEYNQDQNSMTPVQDPIPTVQIDSMDLSNDYLVYRGFDFDKKESSAFIYHRNETNQTFTLHQQFNFISTHYHLALIC